MINTKKSQEKGVSLVSLIIAVIVLIILTNIVVYNVSDSLKIENLKAMQNDVDSLRDKVSSYYIQNGKIPASLKYTNIQSLKEAGVISEAVDTGDFLVIDLSALEDVTLNYGRDFEKVKEDAQNVNTYKDLYIMNETSHNIFYVNGIRVDENTYYTDYQAESVDKKAVEFRSIEGIKIPNEFYYVGGTKEEGITIRSKDDTQEYQWIQEKNKIENIPNDVQVGIDQKEDFIKSVNAYQGYYKSTSSNQVIYLEIQNWSPVYDKEGIYQDKNGDTAYIPAGFQVSKVPGEDMVQNGIVIKNAETGDQYVWIAVPRTIYQTATSSVDYENIEKYIKNYAKFYTDEQCVDEWYNGCGIESETQYQNLKNKMLSSVYEKEGFWVGQFEAGINQPKTSALETEAIDTILSTNGIPLSQEDKYPYHFVNCSQAQQLASKVGEAKEYQTSLMFGIQWDLVCKFLENERSKSEILENSNKWGNYQTETFNIAKGRYTVNPSLASLWNTVSEAGSYEKSAEAVLFTTGVTNRNAVCNLYDLAGNVSELTLEKTENEEPVSRGGHWESEESKYGISMRNNETAANRNIGFRITLY